MHPHIDIMITDQTMPDMRGKERAALAKQSHPGLPILLISGADEPDTPEIDDFLNKPYNKGQLLEKIRSLLSTAPEHN